MHHLLHSELPINIELRRKNVTSFELKVFTIVQHGAIVLIAFSQLLPEV